MQTVLPESGLWISPNWPNIRAYDMTSSSFFFFFLKFFFFFFFFFVKFSYWSHFHVNIITSFWVIRDWPEIRKLEIHPFEFCSISGDWSKLGIPNLAEMSVIKCYSKLQNAKVTAFTVFELLRENQLVI